MSYLLSLLYDSAKNVFLNSDVVYVVEPVWAIHHVGVQITRALRKLGFKTRVSTSPFMIRRSVIHIGSINLAILRNKILSLPESNKRFLTWFHLVPGDYRLKLLPDIEKNFDKVFVSCSTTKQILLSHGLSEAKIGFFPLGVDLDLFRKPLPIEKKTIRKELGIPDGVFVIGSFQKDGMGWGEGNEPKLIKGPDIFCDVVERVARKKKVFVLLTGPARGYVKKRLYDSGIPFIHNYISDFNDLAKYYWALDAYLISSRAEGGPKAVLESLASGVPLITTRVGMAADMIDNRNGLISDIDDVNALAKNVVRVITDDSLRNNLVKNGLRTVKRYSWELVVKKYYLKYLK